MRRVESSIALGRLLMTKEAKKEAVQISSGRGITTAGVGQFLAYVDSASRRMLLTPEGNRTRGPREQRSIPFLGGACGLYRRQRRPCWCAGRASGMELERSSCIGEENICDYPKPLYARHDGTCIFFVA